MKAENLPGKKNPKKTRKQKHNKTVNVKENALGLTQKSNNMGDKIISTPYGRFYCCFCLTLKRVLVLRREVYEGLHHP